VPEPGAYGSPVPVDIGTYEEAHQGKGKGVGVDGIKYIYPLVTLDTF
jgi:hypothetical protein